MAAPEPFYQNSAGRLLAILSGLPPNKPLSEALPVLLGLKRDTEQEKNAACVIGLTEIHDLYKEFRQDMLDAEISEQQRKVLLSGLSSIEKSIYPQNLGAGFHVLTDAQKSLLEVSATIIPEESALKKEDIDLIRESIGELRALVEKADISPSVRKVLLDLIRMSEDAISRFNIHGARGLRKAFKAMLAEAAEAHGPASGTSGREDLEKSGAWTAIVKHIKVFDAVSSRMLKYQPLLQKASQWLLGGPQDGSGPAT